MSRSYGRIYGSLAYGIAIGRGAADAARKAGGFGRTDHDDAEAFHESALRRIARRFQPARRRRRKVNSRKAL